MKFPLFPVLVLTLLSMAGAAALAAPAAAPNAGESEGMKCEERIASVQRDVLGKYDLALQDLQNTLQKAADLEGALAVRAERQRLSQENILTSGQYVNDPKALRTLQTTTVAKLQELVSQLVDETVPKLTEFKKALTVAGRLDEAVAVRAVIERLQGNFLPTGPPPAGAVLQADTVLRAYAADRARADGVYKSQKVTVHGTVAGYRADPDGKHYLLYLGGTNPSGGVIQCSFQTSDFHFREETQFGNTLLVATWGPKDTISIRLQRGTAVDIAGQGGGWDETVRLNKCEFPK